MQSSHVFVFSFCWGSWAVCEVTSTIVSEKFCSWKERQSKCELRRKGALPLWTMLQVRLAQLWKLGGPNYQHIFAVGRKSLFHFDVEISLWRGRNSANDKYLFEVDLLQHFLQLRKFSRAARKSSVDRMLCRRAVGAVSSLPLKAKGGLCENLPDASPIHHSLLVTQLSAWHDAHLLLTPDSVNDKF